MLDKANKATVIAIASVLALGAGALSLTGCGDSGSNTNNANNTENANVVNTNDNTANETEDNANTTADAENGNDTANANASKASKAEDAPNAGPTSGKANQMGDVYVDSVAKDDKYGKGKHHATLTVDGYDPIKIELDADQAPVTVSNFCRLADQKFYDGLTFYRFQEGFCMQGGSSNNGTAIVEDGLMPILGEFAQNGVKNKLADGFEKGTVAMARSGDPNSATSTFFVTLDSGDTVSMSLDGAYAAFGTIDKDGMKVIDQITKDYLKSVDDPSGMGVINEVDNQAKIKSIVIDD